MLGALNSTNPCPVIALQHDGIDVPDEDGEEDGNQPDILAPRVEPNHDGQANDKTAQVTNSFHLVRASHSIAELKSLTFLKLGLESLRLLFQ
ncbi:MAG: hypothetical protein SGJ19_23315 [Planctomycetia bacterium]|nr:hypothetical protein [Planctomycetia bacterium]